MLIEQLLNDSNSQHLHIYNVITTECSQFIAESCGIPLLRSLPNQYADFQKVKARKQKNTSSVNEIFDIAFESSDLIQKAVFAYPSVQYQDNTLEPFYVFPINGYKYMYCTEIANSKQDHLSTIDKLLETLEDEQATKNIMSGVIQYSYVNNNLIEGIKAQAEIIFYDIPYYYAVRTSTIDNYKHLLGE